MAKNKNKRKKTQRDQSSQKPLKNQETPKGFIIMLGVGLLVVIGLAVMSNQSKPTSDTAQTQEENAAQVASEDDAAGTEAKTDKKQPAEAVASKPKAQAKGILDIIPADAATFGGNAERAKAFSELKDSVSKTKNIRQSKKDVEAMWSSSKGNPGGGSVAVLTSYTQLRGRDAAAARRTAEDAMESNPGEQADALKTLSLQAQLESLGRGAVPPPSLIAGLERHYNEMSDPTLKAITAYNLGKAFQLSGQKDDAIAQWNGLARDYPSSPETPKALYDLGKYHQSLDEPKEALAAYNTIMKNHRTSPQYKYASREAKMLQIIGKPGKDVEVEEWINGDPGTLSSELSGKVVVYLFWASWCPHCRREMPEMVKLYETYKDQGLVVIGVTNVDKKQSKEKLTGYLEENDVPFPIAVQKGRNGSSYYAVSGIPAAAIVDRNGEVAWRNHPGRDIEATIKELLGKAS